jgi:hypothetical protein
MLPQSRAVIRIWFSIFILDGFFVPKFFAKVIKTFELANLQ